MSESAEIPEKIDKYEILGIAGRGGMGVVYHGHDPFFDRDVAIKTTQALTGRDADYSIARKMLFNEARAARALDHGAILQIFDAGLHDDEPYVVMEYVPDASTLREHCHPDRLLPIERAAEIIHICAKALDYAHHRGVVHRDIKSSNILLTRDGRVKIGDFGIAKLDKVETTEILGTVGSPRYMSPEQFMDKPVTAQTDLYSLGVVAYELLSGQTPFDGKSFADLARRILSETPRPLRELRPEVPEALERIVARAMQRHVEDRYPTGLGMAADIAAIFTRLEHPPQDLALETKLQMARACSFFNEFSDEELAEMVENCEWQRYRSGERIIREGNMEHSFYVLVSGDVAISKGERRIGTLGTGSCFGEMGYLSRTTRTASIHSRDDAIVMMATVEMMSRVSPATQVRFQQAFVHTLVERLASTTERLSKFLT